MSGRYCDEAMKLSRSEVLLHTNIQLWMEPLYLLSWFANFILQSNNIFNSQIATLFQNLPWHLICFWKMAAHLTPFDKMAIFYSRTVEQFWNNMNIIDVYQTVKFEGYFNMHGDILTDCTGTLQGNCCGLSIYLKLLHSTGRICSCCLHHDPGLLLCQGRSLSSQGSLLAGELAGSWWHPIAPIVCLLWHSIGGGCCSR